MKELLLSFALILIGAAAAQADRGRPAALNPAEPQRIAISGELQVRGALVCVFPDANGGCSGAVTFTYEEPQRDYSPATRPAPSRRGSRRPASAQLRR